MINWNAIRVIGAAAFAAMAEGATVLIEKIARKRDDETCDECNSWDEPESNGVDEAPPEENEEETT